MTTCGEEWLDASDFEVEWSVGKNLLPALHLKRMDVAKAVLISQREKAVGGLLALIV